MTSSPLHVLFVCAAVTTVSAASCLADTCSDVLTNKNFNIYDASTRQLFQNSLLTDMCREEFTSVQDFNKKARSLGSGGNYFAISGFLNLNSNDESANLRTIYNKLCEAKDYRLLDFVSSDIHVQSTDTVVEAWKQCVTNKVGLFSTITLNPESNDFIIHVIYKPSDNKSKLTLTGQPTNAGFDCQYDNQAIKNVDVSGTGDSAEFFLHCTRPSGAGVVAVVNTNAASGAIGPYTVPSGNYIELTQTVEKLRSALQDSERTIQALRGDLTNISTDLKVWGETDNAKANTKVCPEGHYVTGIREIGVPGGRHGVVETSYVYCRPLKLD
ncbi:hypothetical protein OIU34_16615 [Pararhizobium sp. BT-229]|uniref:hypothetical protein n=1 Tax=Pararhizobium sp. BT-229 TaxID=2986923 RepID=UPI0021F71D6A|nr:hypothetical protein [Pararhizobium sp. BT-229]MCV9963527.1 hypothetical protein [Pararhizobium sp. BT-229]